MEGCDYTKQKDQKGRGREKEGKDWTEHGAENRRADVSGELVRGLYLERRSPLGV